MNSETEQAKRPMSITVLCVIGFVGALMTIPLVLSQVAQQVGAWYPPYLGLSGAVGLVCMVGLWMMKKWAVYTYIGFSIINQVVLLSMGVWSFISLLIPAAVILFSYKHIGKMS